MRFRLPILVCLVVLAAGQADAQALKPFKDELFAYPAILSTEDGGDYLVVDYNEARDIDKRDRGAGAPGARDLCLDRCPQGPEGPVAEDRRRHDQALRRRPDRRRPVHNDLPARAGRQPQAGRRRLHLRRQFQPHQEPDGRERRALPVAGFFGFRREGCGRGRRVDRLLRGQVAGCEDLRRLRLDGRHALLAARREQRRSPAGCRGCCCSARCGTTASCPARRSRRRCRSFSARAAGTRCSRSTARRRSFGRSSRNRRAIRRVSCVSRPERTARRSA